MQSCPRLTDAALALISKDVFHKASGPIGHAWRTHVAHDPARHEPRNQAIQEAFLTLLFLRLALLSWADASPPDTWIGNSSPLLDRFPPCSSTSRLRSLTKGCEDLWILHARDASIAAAWSSIDQSFREGCWTCSPELPARLVQAVVPAHDRRRLGEFYTPPWLVEHVLSLVQWPPAWPGGKTLVDPTCGAGAFVVGAIRALRASMPTTLSPKRSLQHVLDSVAGFDISPIAVLGARVGYCASIADLLRDGPLPPLPVMVRDLTRDDGIATADIIAGNPPWIRWSDLEPAQQSATGQWARHYGLVPSHAYHGGSELDAAAVFTYLALDHDLRPGGRAGLVLPASLLRAPASQGFRRMRLPDGTTLGLDHVSDFGSVRIFSGAANRTVVMRWTKGAKTADEFSFDTFVRANDAPPPKGASQAPSLTRTQAIGRRVGTEFRICSSPATSSETGKRLDGNTDWAQGRKGVTTDLNAAYFVRVVGHDERSGLVQVVNDVTRRGHAVPSHTFEVEGELLFPLVKGASQIRAFRLATPTLAVIVPNRSLRRGLDVDEFRRRYPAAYAHFAWVESETEGALSRRSTYRRMLFAAGAPFFFIYNVGLYTFSPYKVLWAEIASELKAAVATTAYLWGGDEPRVVVPDHKVYLASAADETTADYLCALLNSGPVRGFVDAVTEKLQVGSLLGRLKLPRFDADDTLCRNIAATGAEARQRDDGRVDTERLDEWVTTLLMKQAVTQAHQATLSFET